MRRPPQYGGFILRLLLVSCLPFVLSLAERSTSVFLLDSPVNLYFRGRTRDSPELAALSLEEVGASVSVLLGLTPPTTLSASSSSELNKLLAPNPFNRPRAAFVLEVNGVEDHNLLLSSELFKDGIVRKVTPGSDKSNIQLPEDKAWFISLDGPLMSDYPSLTDVGVGKFASWMGGSYVSDTLKELSGHLTVPLQDGASLNLHMEKKADMMYIANLISLVEGVIKAIEMREDISLGADQPAELMKGSFHGIKVLRDVYGSTEITEQGILLFLATLSKLHNLMQAAYKGQVAGLILVDGAASSELESSLNIILASRPSARWLEETQASSNSTEAEVVLVRQTLAWVTGVILLISTLLGIFLLLNMPLTKDTLLYANVKLD